MLSELATLFSGDLARYRNVFVAADDPREAISGEEFLQPQTLSTLMARFRPQFATADQRGLASIWANQYFMRLMIDLAHRIGVGVFAESVETQEEKHMLESLFIDGNQGYYIGKPAPI